MELEIVHTDYVDKEFVDAFLAQYSLEEVDSIINATLRLLPKCDELIGTIEEETLIIDGQEYPLLLSMCLGDELVLLFEHSHYVFVDQAENAWLILRPVLH